MGYRSSVGLAFTDSALAAFKEKLAGQPKILSDFEVGWDNIQAKDGWVVYYAEATKWYISYPEVAAVAEFMLFLDDKGLENQYRFIRCGEDQGDIETAGCGEDPFEMGYTNPAVIVNLD